MQAEAEQRGGQVQLVYTNDLTIKPCIGSMACRTKGKCVLGEDDSQRVLKMMQESDAIIMGAPCYFELSSAIHTLCEWLPRVVMPELGSATICRRSFEATERLWWVALA